MAEYVSKSKTTNILRELSTTEPLESTAKPPTATTRWLSQLAVEHSDSVAQTDVGVVEVAETTKGQDAHDKDKRLVDLGQ